MQNETLNRWGIISVEGEDAASFLHAQLSNDVMGLNNASMRIAGLCTAKGRLLGTFFVVKNNACKVLLICRKDTIAALVKRLSMFVLRSKCKIRDASDELALTFVAQSELSQPMAVQWHTDENKWIASLSLRPLAGSLPSLHIVNATNHVSGNAHDDAFEAVLYELGIAYISAHTVEAFVPQTINLDLVGGISFSKGCYPGQEIVARSHYLGKVKRRVFKAIADGQVAPGTDVWQHGKENEPVGMVATAVPLAEQTEILKHGLLLELPVEATEDTQATFFIKNMDKSIVALRIEQPPYDVHQKGNQFELI